MIGSTDGKCRSSGLLAIAYDALNRTEDALVELEQVQIMSEQAGDMLLQMQAYKALGIYRHYIGFVSLLI